jgi:hemoglobin
VIALLLLLAQPTLPGEEPVDPYPVSDANAGAAPIRSNRLWRAFGEAEGTRRIVDETIRLSVEDPRIADIFKSRDLVRLRRTLFEQFCYILGGGCAYTGRDMRAAHKDMGLQVADLNALIEHLQAAMRREGVPFAAQNRLLAKLAPMKRDVVER